MRSFGSFGRVAFIVGLGALGLCAACGDDTNFEDGESGGSTSASTGTNTPSTGKGAGNGGDDDGSSSSDSSSDSSSSSGSGAGGSIPEGMAMVRVIHASCDAPTVDVWSGNTPLAQGLVYGDTSDWLMVPAGTYDVQIKASPSTPDDPSAYEVSGLELAEGAKTDAIAAGLLGSTEVADKFRVLVVAEDFSPAGSDNAIVRVVHASPDAPTVGIDLHDDDASSPEISNLDRFGSTAAEGFPLTADSALQIGIAASGSKVTAFTTPNLPEGAELLVIATGLVSKRGDDAQGFALLAVGPDGSIGFVKQNPIVYALHGSPDAPAVDLYAGAAKLASLAFGQLGGPVQVPPGDYAIDFRVAGADPASPAAVTAQTGALEAGGRYLSIATGFLGGGANGFQLASYAERFDRSDASEARVRFVHSSPDAPAVDLGILNVEGVVNPVLAGNLEFGGASALEGLSGGLGTLPIGVTPAGQNATVVGSFHVPVVAGTRAFAIAAGALAPANHEVQGFRVLAVDTASTPWSVAAIFPQPQ